MHGFQTYTSSNAPESSRPPLRWVEKQFGFLPHLLGTFAESPAALEGVLALEASLARGSLSEIERELVRLAISAENGCAYCVAAHSTTARELNGSAPMVESLRAGDTLENPRMQALVRFTRRVARRQGFVAAADVDAFFRAGFTRAEVLEVVANIALKTAHNYVHAITAPPLDPAFESQRWDVMQVSVA